MTDLPRAESSVLGSLLISPELAGEIFHRLRPEDFSDATLRTLFGAAREIWLEQRPIDPVILLDRAGAAYEKAVRAIMTETPTAANFAEYCEIVSSAAQLRRIQSAALRIIDADNVSDAREALAAASALLADRNQENAFTWKEMAQAFLERLDAGPETFLDWGIPALNEHLKIRPHSFVVLAAESSVGKTAFALQIAFGMARAGAKVGFFSLETFQEEATDRMMAQLSGVPLPAIRSRSVGAAGARKLFDTAQATFEAPFELIQAAGYSVDEIRAETLARRFEVVFVDYVQLVTARGDSPQEQVRAISMDLHRLCQELGVTVIGLSQVTPPPKNQKGQRPELGKDNLRESHQLIHDAEAILVMDLADLDNYNSNRILKIDKNKDGPRARLLLRFDASRMRFEYLPPVKGTDEKKADARNAKMDANKAANDAKAEKAAESAAALDSFEELGGRSDDLPF